MRARQLTRRRLWPVLLAVAVGTALAAPAALAGPKPPSTSTKYFLAGPAEQVAPAGGTATFRIANCSPTTCASKASTQSFGSVELSADRTGLVLDREHIGLPSGWSVQAVPGTTTKVQLVSQVGSSIAPGAWLDITIGVAGGASGDVTVSTRVKQSNDFSGTGNDFQPTGPNLVVHIGAGPPVALQFVQGASSVQDLDSSATSSTIAPVRSMCPAPQVRAVDASGSTVTWLDGLQVALGTEGADAGLQVVGSTTRSVATVDGVATFGPALVNGRCDDTVAGSVKAATEGTGFRLVATATYSGAALTRAEDRTGGAWNTFDVLPVYGLCGSSCTTPSLKQDGVTSSALLDQGGSTPVAVKFRVEPGAVTNTSCNPDVGAGGVASGRRVVMIDALSRAKSVTLLWSKLVVQEATNNGASLWGVCLEATYQFTGVLSDETVGDGYVARLLPCGDSRLDAADPCLAGLNKTSNGQQRAVVSIPKVDGDPKMW